MRPVATQVSRVLDAVRHAWLRRQPVLAMDSPPLRLFRLSASSASPPLRLSASPPLRLSASPPLRLSAVATQAAGRVQCAAHPRQSRPSRLSVVSRVLYTVDHLGWAACRSCSRGGASWARLHTPNAGRVQCAGELCTKPLAMLPVATQAAGRVRCAVHALIGHDRHSAYAAAQVNVSSLKVKVTHRVSQSHTWV